MENQNKTASEILFEAANLLEYSKDWIQGSFFSASEDAGCSMCAHGAIMYCASSYVKDKADKNHSRAVDAEPAHVVATLVSAAASGDNRALAYYENQAKIESLSFPDYIRKHYQGEWSLAHYMAAKVGLTYSYNDTVGRTKQEVIDKLREAASSSL